MKLKHVVLRRPANVTRNGQELMSSPAWGARAMRTSGSVPTIEIDELTLEGAAKLRRSNEVGLAALVMPMRLLRPTSMADVDAALGDGSTWGVSAVSADTSPFDGSDTVVAVLDTGIDAAHEAFLGVELVRRNFTAAPDGDSEGHGTHCAATIFGRDVRGRRIGVARGVKKAVIGKILGTGGGGSDVVLSAINWALEQGANVISMSLGIDFPGFVKALTDQDVPTEVATSMALEAYRDNVLLFQSIASMVKVRGQFSQPCLLIAAAGNESRRDQLGNLVIGVSPPAVSEGVVSVAALGLSAAGWVIAPFSNNGARVCGPGVGVVSAKAGGGLQEMSGTSMAAPHVVGVAALWAQKLRTSGQFNSQRFADSLMTSATQQGLAPNYEPTSVGGGMVRAPIA